MDTTINNAITQIESHPDYRVLRRLALNDDHVFAENLSEGKCGRLAVIDTETTGLKADLGARIIDLAIATCEYGISSGTLYRVVDRYESLEDPEEPILPEITRLTGIIDEMVRDQRIDEAAIARSMHRVGVVICHNASFDRPFLESRYPALARNRFACSLQEIPWDLWGMKSSKLDYIGFRFGLFHDAHRARADVDMLLALLSERAPEGDGSVLSHLLTSARAPSWRIHALGLPIENKDYAAARGYRWNNGSLSTPRSWWTETRNEQAEREFLAEFGCKSPLVIEQTAVDRYRSLAVRCEEERERAAARTERTSESE